MGDALFCLLAFFGFAAVALVCGLSLRRQVASAWSVVREDMDRFRRIPPLPKAILLVFVVGFVAYGSTKANRPPAMLTAPAPRCDDAGESRTVFDRDIARGWQVCEVRTNRDVCYTMPEGAMMASNWWLRGAYEDVVRVPSSEFRVPSFRFPYGSNEYCSAWAFTWGKLRFALADTNEIVAVGAPMSAVPHRSRLWSAATTNSTLVTWEDFTLGRVPAADCQLPSTNYQLVSAQVELFSNGDFVTRSNEVETVCRRIDPNDFDGDGWHNDDDPVPFFYEELNEDLCQELPDGANTNAYCWIDLRAEYRTWVVFVGDGPSDLPDPVFTAGPDRTCRVQLLIGKTYWVFADWPLTVVGKSSPDIQVDGNGTCELTVCWPVTFTVEPGRVQGSVPTDGTGSSFYVLPNPRFLGGELRWDDLLSCCPIRGDGTNFAYTCDYHCGCQGCLAIGYYRYGGYELMVVGPPCGCGQRREDDPPVGVSASFSERAIIFEDEYEDSPGVFIPWRSTTTELTCSVSGGDYGGRVWFEIEGGQGLVQYAGRTLPCQFSVSSNETVRFVNRYRAVDESASEDDIVVRATFVENETGWVDESETKATAIRVEITPRVFAPANECLHRHKFGVLELANCTTIPVLSATRWECAKGGVLKNIAGGALYTCPIESQNNGLTVSCREATYVPNIRVVEPSGVLASNEFCRGIGLGSGHAGGLLLNMSLHALPLDVSFTCARMEEVPNDEGSHDGYFNDARFIGDWHHGRLQGAGVWNNVVGDNVFLHDEAGFNRELPQLDANGRVSDSGTNGWVVGSVIWNVPCGWGDCNVGGDDEPYGIFAESARQVMTIDANGNCEVRKHSKTARRELNGDMFINGDKVR